MRRQSLLCKRCSTGQRLPFLLRRQQVLRKLVAERGSRPLCDPAAPSSPSLLSLLSVSRPGELHAGSVRNVRVTVADVLPQRMEGRISLADPRGE